MSTFFPDNLLRLHQGEEVLRGEAIRRVEADPKLTLHIHTVERVMDMLDIFRQHSTADEDLKVIQMLSLRLFNAFASSTKLMLAGYYQNSVLVMRDILETVFLLDFFRTNKTAIEQWRVADKQARLKDFRPIKVREALDSRDGFTSKKRAEAYDLFSELAGHPSMQSVAMLRPRGMDARNGPFLDPTALQAVIAEMGKLAIQVGEIVGAFLPADWDKGIGSSSAFAVVKTQWLNEFYPHK